MPFQKGQSGNPQGRPNERPWRDMLMLALNERTGEGKADPKKLRRVAEAVVDAAMKGDMQAAKEIGDRLDGKPSQAITGPDGGSLLQSLTVTYVSPKSD